MFDFNLDMTNVKAAGPMLIDPGTYEVISDEAEIKDSKSGGQYINVKYKVVSGKFEGSYLFNMFNIKNSNQKAVEIGLGQLKAFMVAANIKNEKLSSPTELVGYKALAVVKHRQDDYGTKAVISYFKPIGSELPKNDSTKAEKDVPF